MLKSIGNNNKVKYLHLPFYLRISALILIVFAATNPYTLSSSTRLNDQKTIDIIIALDISESMNAMDFAPTRLEIAKSTISNFISSKAKDPIGLVLFSAQSYTLVPLTADYYTILQNLKPIVADKTNEGTAIGLGLATAINRLEAGKSKSKVVILITDGENNSGNLDPITAAKIASAKGIKIYTIGIGGNTAAQIEIEQDGKPILAQMEFTLDEKLLKEIAFITQAKYFRAQDDKALLNIYMEIDNLERTKIMANSITATQRILYPYFLISALVLLFIEFILRTTYLKRLDSIA